MNLRLDSLSRLNRDAKLLILVSGVSAVSFFGIQMLLKVLYVLRLGHGPEFVGWFNGTSSLAYMGMGIPSGALGGRFGTRRIMMIGAVIMIIGMFFLPLTEFVPSWAWDVWPLVSQATLTAGWSMFNVNLVPALMAVTTAADRDGTYALSNASRLLGTVAGTLAGGELPGLFARLSGGSLDAPDPYRNALFVGAAFATASLVPLIMMRPVQGTVVRPQVRTEARGAFPKLPIALMIGYVYLRHAGWATCQSFSNAYMDVDLHLSASSIGLITGAGQFLAMLGSLLTPRLAARWSNGWTLVASTVGVAVSLVPMALVPHWVPAAIGRLGVFVLAAIWISALQVFQMELVDSQWRSLAYGTVSMAMGLGFSTTSLTGGYIIAATGYQTLFWVGSGLSLIAATMFGFLLNRRILVPAASEATDHSSADSQTAPT